MLELCFYSSDYEQSYKHKWYIFYILKNRHYRYQTQCISLSFRLFSYNMISSIYSTKIFEIIINTQLQEMKERSQVPFTQFSLMVTSCKTIEQYKNQNIYIDRVKIQKSFITTRIPLVHLLQTSLHEPLLHPRSFTTTNLFSISTHLSHQEC